MVEARAGVREAARAAAVRAAAARAAAARAAAARVAAVIHKPRTDCFAIIPFLVRKGSKGKEWCGWRRAGDGAAVVLRVR